MYCNVYVKPLKVFELLMNEFAYFQGNFIFLYTQETVVKKTITGIKSKLIYSKAVYKYEKNEGSYHSGI